MSSTPIRFDSARSKPRRLKGRNCCVSKKTLADILKKQDETLDWNDFRDLFSLCDGPDVYEDRAYFLPLTFEYLRTNPGDGLEYLSQVLWFISEKEPLLSQDRLTAWCRKAVKTCFEEWTSRFRVIHYDTAACRAKQWVIDHNDIVENSQIVGELLGDLLQFQKHADLALELGRSLVPSGNTDNQAAWFLELARSPWGIGFGDRSEVSDASLDNWFQLDSLFADGEVLQREYDRLRETLISTETSPTYWRDLREALRLKE